MSALPSHPVGERFRAAIAGQLGLAFGDDKHEFLDTILSGCAEAQRVSREDYVRWLEDAPCTADLAVLGRALTVGETYFLRNIEQFDALAEIAVPACAPCLRLLSAGCATGEEAYSLALTLSERAAASGWDLSIRAVDINEEALAAARRGWYSPWSLRATSPELQARWFQPQGRGWVLDSEMRQAVSFAAANLAEDDPALWAEGSYDVIFCRNVMMYFAPAQARALVARIARALVPGGYLFLGHAENLRGLSDAFQLCQSHGTFYYQRITAYSRRAAGPVVVPAIALAPVVTSVPGVGWYEGIHQASARIACMVAPAVGPALQALPVEPVLADALELMRCERFVEALAQLRRLPLAHQHNPDALLLEAMLLVQQGEPGAAEQACGHLLARDVINAGAHYVMALCREQAGDTTGAAEHDQIALHLDPHFAMPRLHLGLLARRAGQRDAARRDLQQALHLLAGEDNARLVLFGGGFGRAALLALCESALRDCGGRA